MDMYQSEKNLLEKLADAIPGLKGYREKESRRDTDKRFREYLAGRIEAVRSKIDDSKREIVSAGRLDGLAEIDRLSQKAFKAAGMIRYASYGYSGFFDQVKIQETELDRLYQYDLSLVGDIEALEASIPNIGTNWRETEDRINSLESRIEERKNLFTVTG
jgi:chromosome segregation ATPase